MGFHRGPRRAVCRCRSAQSDQRRAAGLAIDIGCLENARARRRRRVLAAALVDQAAQSAEPVWRTSIRPTKSAPPGGAGEEPPAKI